METLKLEHIAPYFPYSLKVLVEDKKIGELVSYDYHLKDKSIVNYTVSYDLDGDTMDDDWLVYNDGKYITRFKPILRSLSELNKPIQHNGEEFVPEYKMWEASENKDFIIKLAPSGAVHNETPYWAFQKLIEWKFNVFNLPPHLWIDVNTLEENPYK